MKKTLKRIKTGLATLWLAIVSFFSKVLGQYIPLPQPEYWVENPGIWMGIEKNNISINMIAKITEKILVIVIFIIWIVSLISIIKTKDKKQRKRIVKKTIIIIAIIVSVILLISLAMRLLRII